MSDTSGGVGSIQSWIQSVDSAFATLPSTIEQSSGTGDFSDVLAGIQNLLAGGGAPAAPVSTDPVLQTTGQQALLSSALSSSEPTGQSVVTQAEQYLGVPYVWGGTTPASGFDCSGFVQYVYGQLGVSLPRTSEEQAQIGTPVDSLADAQPGDLVFFPGTDGTASSPGHVGIYLGNGEIIDAPETGSTVSIQPVGSPTEIRRVLAGPSATLTSATFPAPAASGGEPPAALAPLFAASAARYGVPENLLVAVADTESGFNTSAVSSSGAQGLMQLMPSTASGLGVDPFDPAQAIDGAAQLLSGYLQQFKSTPLALAAYNAGAGAVEQYGGIPPFAQTQSYVQSIMNQIGSTE